MEWWIDGVMDGWGKSESSASAGRGFKRESLVDCLCMCYATKLLDDAGKEAAEILMKVFSREGDP